MRCTFDWRSTVAASVKLGDFDSTWPFQLGITAWDVPLRLCNQLQGTLPTFPDSKPQLIALAAAKLIASISAFRVLARWPVAPGHNVRATVATDPRRKRLTGLPALQVPRMQPERMKTRSLSPERRDGERAGGEGLSGGVRQGPALSAGPGACPS